MTDPAWPDLAYRAAAGGPERPITTQLTVDCDDPHSQAEFWAAALGYAIEDAHAMVEAVVAAGYADRDKDTIEIDGRLGWRTGTGIKHPGVRSGADLTVGERAADRMRNFMGSWPFVFGFFAVMGAWVVINSVLALGGPHGFDPYPYILLNLFLSMLAGVQAAALLIAAKRADAIASEIAIHTEKNTDDLKGLLNENTTLTRAMKENTDLLEEIHRHVAALRGLPEAPAGFGSGDVAGGQPPPERPRPTAGLGESR